MCSRVSEQCQSVLYNLVLTGGVYSSWLSRSELSRRQADHQQIPRFLSEKSELSSFLHTPARTVKYADPKVFE